MSSVRPDFQQQGKYEATRANQALGRGRQEVPVHHLRAAVRNKAIAALSLGEQAQPGPRGRRGRAAEDQRARRVHQQPQS